MKKKILIGAAVIGAIVVALFLFKRYRNTQGTAQSGVDTSYVDGGVTYEPASPAFNPSGGGSGSSSASGVSVPSASDTSHPVLNIPAISIPTFAASNPVQNLSNATTTITATASNLGGNADTSNNWSDFVSHLYAAIGRKAPDAQGQQYWATKLAGGESQSQVAAEFLTSASKLTSSNVADVATSANNAVSLSVDSLYKSIGNNSPDAGGLAYWSGKLKSGEALPDVQREFLSSASTFQTSTNSVQAMQGSKAAQLLKSLG